MLSTMAAVLQQEEVVIVGAGIAGLATSLALHRLGIRSLVLESAPSLRVTGFALATWTNAWRALDALGLGDALRQQHKLIDGVVLASTITEQTSAEVPFSGNGHEARCVQRKLLLEAMEKELPVGTIKYSSNVVSMEDSESDSGFLVKSLHLSDGTVIETKVLIGCDGVNSMVANWLGFSKAAFTGRSAVRSVAIFPQGHEFGSKFLLFVGKGFRAGCIACDDKTLYWFFTWTPSTQEKDLQDNPAKLKEFVLSKLQNTPNMKKVVENTETERIMSSPLRYRRPWEVLMGNISKGNVCVAGDALHPMTPDIGQGGCSALEDGVTLGRCLAEALKKQSSGLGSEEIGKEESKRIEAGLSRYAKERRWRSFELIATSYLVGRVQQSEGKIGTFVRDHVLAKFLAGLLLKRAEFDCGKLSSY
ncbi:unnamed protein product [Linum tenue]|uniref:FAD-binding domain-containing protein n=1 Tax=Linum tenue TaxID=586396 RepID=A0AAV0PDD5_9ROSI|nr:unnamed protein product [Linum tenue]